MIFPLLTLFLLLGREVTILCSVPKIRSDDDESSEQTVNVPSDHVSLVSQSASVLAQDDLNLLMGHIC